MATNPGLLETRALSYSMLDVYALRQLLTPTTYPTANAKNMMPNAGR